MIYEVFRRERKGHAFEHAGSVAAPDIAFAEAYAHEQYGRRGESVALWVVPQKLGGGTVSGLATHAQHNRSKNSAANASFPFWTELAYTLWPLVLERLEIATLAVIGITSYLVFRSERRLGSWSAALRQHPAAVAASIAGAFGFIWWLGISAETQEGFAGNPRYAIIGVMLVCISGTAAYGWACTGLARLAGAGLRRLGERRPGFGARAASWKVRLTGATTFMVLLFLFVPNWFAHRMPSVASIRYTVRYQAELRERMSYLINDYGGADKVRSCGSLMTNNFQVTMLAWDLGSGASPYSSLDDYYLALWLEEAPRQELVELLELLDARSTTRNRPSARDDRSYLSSLPRSEA